MADGKTNGVASNSADDGSGGQGGDSSSTSASMAGALLLMAAIGAGAWWALWPQDISPAKDPGFGDNVFASAPVVFAARLILVSAGVVLAVAGYSLLCRSRCYGLPTAGSRASDPSRRPGHVNVGRAKARSLSSEEQ